MKHCFFHIFFVVFLLIPLAAGAQDMAYPVEGDGILSFLRRYNRTDTSYLEEFKKLNADKLGAQGDLKLGVVYLIPPLHPGDTYSPDADILPTVADARIFGAKYAKLTPQSNALKDACFYIIAGHGGPDPGALTKIDGRTLHEDEYNYDFALRLSRNLMQHGATVYIVIQDDDGIRDERFLAHNTTETCFGEPIPKSQIDRLKQRVNSVNSLYGKDKKNFKYIRAVEIHIDSRSAREQIDFFMYYADNRQSRLTAHTLRDELEKQYRRHQPGRGFSGSASHRNLYILRQLDPPAIMVEVGNFQNARDRERILNPNNRQAIANWLTQAFLKDYERAAK